MPEERWRTENMPFMTPIVWHRPNLGNGGKITKQEQVYKVAEGSGW